VFLHGFKNANWEAALERGPVTGSWPNHRRDLCANPL